MNFSQYQDSVARSIRQEEARTKARIEGQGYRDIVNVMIWPDGLTEVRGTVALAHRSTRKGFAGVLEIVKAKFGSGRLVKIGTDSIEGRPVHVYGVK